ncbi:unnamed protein product [Heterobilharzia americana]|nr:unnamed protein product [Heterobilharzia americana]
MSPIILRLRHLRAVYGRNFDVFCHEYGSAVGITFALSSVDSDDIGYYYVSEVATNIENPEWEPVEMNSLPKQYRASKGLNSITGLHFSRAFYLLSCIQGESSLHNLISQGLTAEQISVAIDSVKRRTEATKYSISIARNKVKQLESKNSIIQQELLDMNENKETACSRLETLNQS